MKRITTISALFVLVFLLVLSCKEIESYSEIPGIKYKNFELSDYLLTDTSALGFKYIRGLLTFEFKDGDGDFGIIYTPRLDDDTIYNVLITLYEMREGEYFKIENTDSTLPDLNRRIMQEDPMIREGQNKLLKGTIELEFKYLKTFPYDSFRYDFYIKDRANHRSNVESTDLIVVDWNSYRQ